MPALTASRAFLLVPFLAGHALAQDNAGGSQATGNVVPADTAGWQALARDLFLSGESSLVDPGRIEPLPRQIFKLGPVELLPKIDEQVVYDDNVFLTEKDEERDFILRTGLGLLADYRFGSNQHRLSAGYDMTRHWFLGGEAKNFVEQLASVQLELRFRRLELAIGDRFEDRTDPILSVFTGKIERNINTVHGRAAWREDEWTLELRAQRSTTAFDDSSFEAFDRDEDLASLEWSARAEEELTGFARLDGMARSFDQNALNDMDGVAGSVGVRARRGTEIDAMARVGVRAESFDDGAATDADDSAINPELEARLRWWLIQSAALELRVERTTEFSPISNYEVASRGEVTWMHQLETRLSARVGSGIEHIDPSNTDASFVRYTFGAGMRYALSDNADLTLGWRLRMRHTRAATGDYSGNQFTLGVALRL